MFDFFARLSQPQDSSNKARAARTAQYLFAVVAAVLAIVVRLLLQPLLGEHYLFLIPLFGVVAAAWLGGLGPALVSLLLGLLGVLYLLLPPYYSLAVHGFHHRLGLVLYLVVGVACALLGELQRTVRHRLLVSLRQLTEQRQALLEREARLRAWRR